MFGENTDADREKLRQDIEDIHAIFKTFVTKQRPGLDIDRVATGEHRLGRRAKDLGLCDTLVTSDDYLLEANERAELVGVRFVAPKRLSARLAESMAVLAGGAEAVLWQSAKDRRLSL